MYTPHTNLEICFKLVLCDLITCIPRPAPLAPALVGLHTAWLFSGNWFDIHQQITPKSHGALINTGLTSAVFTNEFMTQRLKALHQFS